eukprot:1156170-Pelagomonas_calceolata.AAC.2
MEKAEHTASIFPKALRFQSLGSRMTNLQAAHLLGKSGWSLICDQHICFCGNFCKAKEEASAYQSHPSLLHDKAAILPVIHAQCRHCQGPGRMDEAQI